LLVGAQGGGVLEETQETEEIIQRVAALDIGKAELTCCVRVPSPGKHGRRAQEVRTYQTMTRWLLVMADRLRELGVTRVVMEATSDYWRGVFYLLEAHGFEAWLVNARDVKHLPGGPRPTPWMRSGCVRWPSGRCCGPASSPQDRSGSCGR
jgi:transposase